MAADPHRPNRRSILFRLGGTVLAFALLVYLLVQQGWDEIAAAFGRLTWWQVTLAIVLTFVSRLAVSMRWYALLRSARAPLSVGQVVRITFAGLFASNFLPTTIGGDVVRLGGALRLGCDRGVGLASLVVDRLVGMAGMAMAAPLSLPALADGGLQNILSGGSAASGLVVPAGRWERLAAKVRAEWRRLADALIIWWKQPGSLLLALGFTWVHMLAHFTSILVFLRGMDESMPFWLIAGAWSLTYFLTLIPVSINGLGLQELSTTLIFAGLGGVSTVSAITLSVLIRVVQMLASLPGALFIPEMIAGNKPGGTGEKQ